MHIENMFVCLTRSRLIVPSLSVSQATSNTWRR